MFVPTNKIVQRPLVNKVILETSVSAPEIYEVTAEEVIVAFDEVLLKIEIISPVENTPLGITMLPPDPIATKSPTSPAANV